MPGTEARIRVSSVMLPLSSCGTLRSARMKTRLPETSRSVSRLKLMADLGALLVGSGCEKGAPCGHPPWAQRAYLAITRIISSTLQE